MKLPQVSNKFKWNYLSLAFLLPMALMLVIYFITSITPFGGNTLLYSDNFHQYYPFFRQFRQALRSGDNLLWTWSIGMGMDYLGLISYYLASPLNLVSVLIPEGWVLSYFTLLMPIKLGLASGFFALMVKKLFGRDDLSLPLFGSFYAMCAWALGYQWNIMWLDSFAMLPLVALGTILLLKEKKYLLYTLALTVAVLSNFYIGLFVCIFVFLLFWCYEICRFQSIPRLLGDFLRIGFFTVLALGMTVFLELPTLAALQDTYSSVNQFPSGFDLNIVSSSAQTSAREAWTTYRLAKETDSATLTMLYEAVIASIPPVFDAMRQVAGQIGGGQTPTYMEGLPNLYCGVFPIALGWLFLLSKDVKWRDKICCVALLLLLMCSFIFRQLDYIWHGFHFTNQIPYRFSFLFSFVVLYMAYRAWLMKDRFPLWQILLSGALSIAMLLLSGHSKTDYLYWLFNIAFLGLYLVCMVVSHRRYDLLCKALRGVPSEESSSMEVHLVRLRNVQRRRAWASSAIAATMALELVLHTALFFSGFSIANYDYPQGEKSAATLFDSIETLDGDSDFFYRTEVTHAQTLNDGALNGYHGISTFSSSANVATTEFMQSLGAAAQNNWNRYCYEESSPVSNLFLNLKYMVERNRAVTDSSIYQVRKEEGGLTLLENKAYLPLGFLADSALAGLEFRSNNYSFTFQNRLFQEATGLLDGVWTILTGKALTVTGQGDTSVKQASSSGYTNFSTGNSGTLVYTYQISKAGYLCLDLSLGKHKNFSVWHNGTRLYDESYSLAQLMAVGDVQAGDTVEIRITCAANLSSTSVSIKAAILNEAVFWEGYDILNASTLTLTQFATNRLSGTITCNRDGLLYTSVPQDGNWVAYVDGKQADIVLVGDCMVGLMLTEGQHTIQLRYVNKAFRTGALISAGCALVFAAIAIGDDLRRKKKMG